MTIIYPEDTESDIPDAAPTVPEPTYYRNSEDGNMDETYGSGGWVMASDYKKLRAKLAAAEARTKQKLTEAANIAARCISFYSGNEACAVFTANAIHNLEDKPCNENVVLKAQLTSAEKHSAAGLTAEMIRDHYPQTQHQPDECELCHAVYEIAEQAITSAALLKEGK